MAKKVILLKNFGVEGETYKMIDNYPTYTDFVTQNPNGNVNTGAIKIHKSVRTIPRSY